jgi:hypothetical protein
VEGRRRPGLDHPGGWAACSCSRPGPGTCWRLRAKAAERARVEGPDVDEPVTWYRKSGSWAVIVFAAGVFGIFGLVWLLSGQIR